MELALFQVSESRMEDRYMTSLLDRRETGQNDEGVGVLYSISWAYEVTERYDIDRFND